jgi:multiple sugar transport system permease protein
MAHDASRQAPVQGRVTDRPLGRALRALPWNAPATILIFGVVLFPAGYLIFNSTQKFGLSGLDLGSAGFANYAALFQRPEIFPVLLNTFVWVISVVVITVLLSLALAQFLNQKFPGRRIVRIAVLVPWAASTVMTSLAFVYGLNPFYGVINKFLVDVHILRVPLGFTEEPLPAFLTAMAVGVFVSLSFTTYVILAGLAAVPNEVLEAAAVDGATSTRTYFSIVLPLLRPALVLATLINIINVFNNFPVLKLITGALPGYSDDTTTTLMFKILQSEDNLGVANALSVVNFVIVLIVIAVFLRVAQPLKEVDS